jgi:phospholipid/cholesterol/gamma-HCH transport system substrate-binding protein
MQSRAVREGSVGLMLLAGVGIFVAASMWLKGLGPGSQKYNITAQFTDAGGIQQGGPVRYRGVRVGKIAAIKPGANLMEVTLEITDPDLKIPSNAIAEANQTGLIGEPVVEITPRGQVNLSPDLAKALDSNCDSKVIICHNGQIPGTVGSSFNELLKRATALVNRYESPEIVDGIKLTLKNSSQAAADISLLSRKFSELPESVKKELGSISASANTLTKSLDVTVKNVDGVVQKIGGVTTKFGNTADQFTNTATRVNKTADNLTLTVAEYGKLAKSVDSLVVENRQSFSKSLTNFSTLSADLSQTVKKLNPTIDKLNNTVTKVNSESVVKDLEGVLANANKTAANLRDISASFNNPKSLLNLQQTLDSARLTFQNTQKITADLDRLTGDPEFLDSINKLVKGLGQLVSSGETLEQQIQLAKELAPVNQSMSETKVTLLNTDPDLAAAISQGEGLANDLGDINAPTDLPTPRFNHQRKK